MKTTARWPQSFREEMAGKSLNTVEPWIISGVVHGFQVRCDDVRVKLFQSPSPREQVLSTTQVEAQVYAADLNCGCGATDRPTVEDVGQDWKRWHATWCPCNRLSTNL